MYHNEPTTEEIELQAELADAQAELLAQDFPTLAAAIDRARRRLPGWGATSEPDAAPSGVYLSATAEVAYGATGH